MLSTSIRVFLFGLLVVPRLLALESNVVGYVMENGEAKTVMTNLPIKKIVAKSCPEVKVHLAEKLSYSTTLLEVTDRSGGGTGTGFFYSFLNPKLTVGRIPAIFTNKHVMDGASSVSFYMHTSDGKGGIGKPVHLRLPREAILLIPHPDPLVDLCCFLIGPILGKLHSEGVELISFEYNKSYIPTEEYLKDVTQLDEVVMIGYPGGIRDRVNNQPIFRRGVLATNPSLDFDGKKQFLIDMPVYWGSSGSPILLYAEGMHPTRHNGSGFQTGNVLKLLGINFATKVADAKGRLKLIPIPMAGQSNDVQTASTPCVPVPIVQIPNNLGVVIKSSRILEVEDLLWKAFEQAERQKNSPEASALPR